MKSGELAMKRYMPSRAQVIAWMIISIVVALLVGATIFVVTKTTDMPAQVVPAFAVIIGIVMFSIRKAKYAKSPRSSKKQDVAAGRLEDTSEIPVVTNRRFPHTPMPELYHERASILSFISAIASIVGVLIASLIVLLLAEIAVTLIVFILIIVILTVSFAVRREWWRYVNRPRTCDPTDGVLTIHQTGKFWPWLIVNSSPETFGIDDLDLESPRQSVIEQIFFKNSETLILPRKDGREFRLRYCLNIKHLLDIQKWRASQANVLAEDQLEETRRSNRLQEEQLSELRALRQRLDGGGDTIM